jgi:hypothetical protein
MIHFKISEVYSSWIYRQSIPSIKHQCHFTPLRGRHLYDVFIFEILNALNYLYKFDIEVLSSCLTPSLIY